MDSGIGCCQTRRTRGAFPGRAMRRALELPRTPTEREKLPGLARELGWSLEENRIAGRHRNKSVSIEIDDRLLGNDLLLVSLEAPSALVVSVYTENFKTRAIQIFGQLAQSMGFPVYADFETGDPEIDSRLFFSVRADHLERLKALIEEEGTLPLLKKIFSRFEHVNMTGKEIQFLKPLETGDLDSAAVQASLEWIKELDGRDGIYL